MFVHDNTPFLVLIHGPVAFVHLALTANVVFATKHFAGGLEGVLEGHEIVVELVALAGGAGIGGGGGGGGGHVQKFLFLVDDSMWVTLHQMIISNLHTLLLLFYYCSFS